MPSDLLDWALEDLKTIADKLQTHSDKWNKLKNTLDDLSTEIDEHVKKLDPELDKDTIALLHKLQPDDEFLDPVDASNIYDDVETVTGRVTDLLEKDWRTEPYPWPDGSNTPLL